MKNLKQTYKSAKFLISHGSVSTLNKHGASKGWQGIGSMLALHLIVACSL